MIRRRGETDLMARVRDADPIADDRLGAPERAEADVLLRQVLEDSGSEERRPSRSLARWPRALVATAAVACLALVGLTAYSLLDGGAGPTVVDRAYAAVSNDEGIYHFVLDTNVRADALPPELRADVALANGRLEGWYRSDGSAFHSRQLRRGRGRLRPVYEAAAHNGRVIDYDPEKNVLGRARRSEAGRGSRPLGPLDEFREAYRDGKVLERGKATFNGRPAYRLLIQRSLEAPDNLSQRIAYYVDRKTYLPLGTREQTRLMVGKRPTAIRSESVYRVYERIPDTLVNRRLLRIAPRPGARRVDGPAFLAP